MRLGKALATGIAEEQPIEERRVEDAVLDPERVQEPRESADPAPVEVAAAR
ncbi:hypothetical protein ACIBKX_00700 [Streptomyces sp. NPDC050658]|uniref:hypothetical protein n=1 Tax=unclassified Streptomyces TaxID=2593676 RepID=UPI00341C7D54